MVIESGPLASVRFETTEEVGVGHPFRLKDPQDAPAIGMIQSPYRVTTGHGAQFIDGLKSVSGKGIFPIRLHALVRPDGRLDTRQNRPKNEVTAVGPCERAAARLPWRREGDRLPSHPREASSRDKRSHPT